MSKLIILRGNSGSGKTTVAELLQQKFGPNTMRLSHDMIRMEVLHVWGQVQRFNRSGKRKEYMVAI